MTVAGLVLAAGAGRRFGGPKALAVFEGERLVDRAVRVAVAGGCRPVVVVSGAAPLEVPGATVVHNPDWPSGMASSLKSGLAALPAAVSAAVVVLVDTPRLEPAAIGRVIAAHRTGVQLAVATYSGERAHPVLLGRAHWPGIMRTAQGDVGARGYLAGRDDVAEIDCTGLGDPADIDTADGLRRA